MSKTLILGMENTITRGPRAPGGEQMGRCDERLDELWLCSDLPPTVAESTLIHEFVHQVSGYLHLGLSEEQVCGLEVALYQAGFRVKEYEVDNG